MARGLHIVLMAALCVGIGGHASLAQPYPAGFNEDAIQWRSVAAGLAEAKDTGKPVVLVVHATWCPVCQTYRDVFSDPEVVTLMRRVVPVLVDQDREPEDAAHFAPDGDYMPRTLVLSPSGELLSDYNSGWADYLYFYAPDRAEPLAAMLQRLTGE
ncbi:thioredoxin family protein [Sagittula salina]|uniref:Thioredoxin family protein n=1 Tax=Sagittula salina TaxID=2820268 RepID=A0A940S2X7_9RHOB|nr:thioredoxin family protein [Sagittula salina]MBP0482434.1 thioredoxin family protein [Sagittula salina]